MTSHIYIQSLGGIEHVVNEALPDLKEAVVQAVGQPVRRISRFMQLALIGAGRCAQNRSLPANTAVYLASGRGDFEITLDVLNQVFRSGQSPKPLSFVNTVSNAAAFYVAKCLQLQARSNFVCNRHFAFESALQLAFADLQLGGVDSALIGAVDCAVAPLAEHRQRLGLASAAHLAEASHWLWLSRDSQASLGAMLDVHHATNRDALLEWIAAQSLDGRVSLSGGQFLSQEEFDAIKERTGLQRAFDYRQSRGHYDSQSAAVIGEFLHSAPHASSTLLHINGDPLGRYCAMLVGGNAHATDAPSAP